MLLSEPNTLGAEESARIFLAAAALLISASFFGHLFRKLTLPKVIGEIVGGLVLGPTLAGSYMPGWYSGFFANHSIFIFYWLGLILLMFAAGLEVEKSFNKGDKKIITTILIGSTVIPFSVGWLIPSLYDCSEHMGRAGNMLALKIFFAVATAVTSIPVISKIFMDLGILESRFAKIVLAIAIIHDAILYVAIAAATNAVNTKSESIVGASFTGLKTFAFFAVTLLVAPKVLRALNGLKFDLLPKSSATSCSISICLLFVAAAGLAHINVMFGGFMAGMLIGFMPGTHFSNARAVIKEISLSFFVSIYFAIVGLKLDLIHQFNLGSFVGFFTFSSIVQFAGTIWGVKALKKDWLTCINFAMAMNARGGPGIVLASLGFELGIISESFFTTLVLTAIVTSLIAGWWFKFVLSRGWELLSEAEGRTYPVDPLPCPDDRRTHEA
jgi:K+:H+ antiporter